MFVQHTASWLLHYFVTYRTYQLNISMWHMDGHT